MYRALVFATLMLAGNALPQGVTIAIAPSGSAPPGCVPTHAGKFGITMVDVASKKQTTRRADGAVEGLGARDDTSKSHAFVPEVDASLKSVAMDEKANGSTAPFPAAPNCVTPKDGTLLLTLKDGVMHDSFNRTAYIADNYQWQFDQPPQTGAISTAGYSICSNNTVALGSSAIWWSCLSGSFYNIYDRWWAAQCVESYMEVVPVC